VTLRSLTPISLTVKQYAEPNNWSHSETDAGLIDAGVLFDRFVPPNSKDGWMIARDAIVELDSLHEFRGHFSKETND